MMKKFFKFLNKMPPEHLLLGTFAVLIVAGTLVLMLPDMTTHGISLINALFTSTSASCVTGLTVVNTPTAFTFLGQFVIMLLIQIGGLGVMTLTTFFAILSGRKITLRDRAVAASGLNIERYGGIVRLLIWVVRYTVLIEASGAMVLFFRFYTYYPRRPLYAFWISIFHSVSAFCNAGFALFSNNLENFPSDPVVNITIMALIILGGLGFVVLAELDFNNKPRWWNLSFNTKVVLVTTGGLILFGFLALFLIDFAYMGKRMALGNIIWISLFQAVTPRTAGFDTYPIANLPNPAQMVIILLMFIGGSPGSTAGGIKTTTFATLLLKTFGYFRGKDGVDLLKRRVGDASFRKSLAVLFTSMGTVFVGLTLLTGTDPMLPFKSLLFEVFSAFGTVGLDLGISPSLSDGGKLTIVLLMYLGRMGVVTFFSAILRKNLKAYTYPAEDIMIG